MTKMSELARKRFQQVSTATLTTVLFKKGFKNVFLQNVSLASSPVTSMVGEAFTLRYIPAREDLDGIDAFDDPKHPQRVAVEECPSGNVLVMDSRGDPTAASSGNILVNRLYKRGVAGVVTDGGFRDTPEIVHMRIPAYHQRPSAPTNLIKHHAVDIQLPIACGGVAIYPGDVMVGDREGVVCIPCRIAEVIAHEAYEQTIYEDWVEMRIEDGAGLFGVYPLTDSAESEAFALWKRKNIAQYAYAEAL